jgi:hypothetical protein
MKAEWFAGRLRETEDEFVHRAKEAIRDLLLAKFGGPASEAEQTTIRTSDPDWLEQLAAAYAKRRRATIIDEAGLGVDPARHTILQMGHQAGLSAARWSKVLVALGVSTAAAAVILVAVLDPEPTTKLALLVAGGGMLLFYGGMAAVRILTGFRPPNVTVTGKGFEIDWEKPRQPE